MNYNARSIIVAFSFTTAKVQQKMRVCNSRMHFLTQSQENGAFFYAKSSFCTNFFHGVTKLGYLPAFRIVNFFPADDDDCVFFF